LLLTHPPCLLLLVCRLSPLLPVGKQQEQRKVWDGMALVYFVKQGPRLLVWLFSKLLALLLFNRFVLWFGGGVPAKQYALIRKDGIPIEQYLGRTVDGEFFLVYFLFFLLLRACCLGV
jgi:hypothetical protein